jgi:hypothetical protein
MLGFPGDWMTVWPSGTCDQVFGNGVGFCGWAYRTCPFHPYFDGELISIILLLFGKRRQWREHYGEFCLIALKVCACLSSGCGLNGNNGSQLSELLGFWISVQILAGSREYHSLGSVSDVGHF